MLLFLPPLFVIAMACKLHVKLSQVKFPLPKFHRAESALRSQAAGGVGVCASVAPPAFGCRLGCVRDIFRSRVIFLVPIFCWKAEGDVSLGFGAGVAGLGCVLPRGLALALAKARSPIKAARHF